MKKIPLSEHEKHVGKRYGRFTVIGFEYKKRGVKNPANKPYFKCTCDCGVTKLVCRYKLLSGHTRACGCQKLANTKEYLGKKFGRLTIEKFSHIGERGESFWVAKCECGEVRKFNISNLKRGVTKSCGCYHKDIISSLNKGHGLYMANEYKIWSSIKARCLNPNNPGYKNYGGRGIKVCKQWEEDFMNFYNDMGKRPSKKHSIERVDNNKGYNPENCIWATIDAQANNKRTCRLITYKGQTKNLTQWSKKLGISYDALRGRICKYDWPIEKAFTTPVKTFNR